MPSEGGHAAAERTVLCQGDPVREPPARATSRGHQPGPPAHTSSRDVGEGLASDAPQHASGIKAGLQRPEAPEAAAHALPPPEAPGSQPSEVCHQRGHGASRTEQTATGHSSLLGPCLYCVWHSALGGVKMPGTPPPGAGNPAGAGTAERWPSRWGVEPRSSREGLIAGAPPCPSFTDPARVNLQVPRCTLSTHDPVTARPVTTPLAAQDKLDVASQGKAAEYRLAVRGPLSPSAPDARPPAWPWDPPLFRLRPRVGVELWGPGVP